MTWSWSQIHPAGLSSVSVSETQPTLFERPTRACTTENAVQIRQVGLSIT